MEKDKRAEMDDGKSKPLSPEGRELLKCRIHDDFMERIYAFSCNRLRNVTDAEDLSQEIILELLSSIERGASIQNFNAWLWRVAHHTFCHWINRRKIVSQVICCGDSLPDVADDGDAAQNRREQVALLHREISFLSRRHRDVIVGHYLDGKSCEAVAQELGIPLGSVKRLLSEGRNELKNGVLEMNEIGKSSYKPRGLNLGISGSGGALGTPFTLVKRKLAQTILLEAYEDPRSVEELAREIGVACPYVEDELSLLEEGELMRRLKDGKYQTDFLIIKEPLWKKITDLEGRLVARQMPVFRRILDAVKDDFMKMQLNSQGLPWERLLWVMISKASVYRSDLPQCGDCPKRKDGGAWFGLGREKLAPKKVNEWSYSSINGPWISPSLYILGTYWTRGQKFAIQTDPNKPALDNEDIKLCGLAFSGKLDEKQLNGERKEKLASLIKDGLIEKRNGNFKLLVTGFTKKQSDAIDSMIREKSGELRKIRKDNFEEMFNFIRPQIPEHISDDNVAIVAGIHGFRVGLAYKDYYDRGELEPFNEPEKAFTPSMCLIFED